MKQAVQEAAGYRFGAGGEKIPGELSATARAKDALGKIPGVKSKLNAANQAAPGSASTQIKIKSPTQAEQIQAGIGANSSFNTNQKAAYGDKDIRNSIAHEDVRLVLGKMGPEATLFDAVDFINAKPGLRTAEEFKDLRGEQPDDYKLIQAYADKFNGERPGPKPNGFVGEGMFGQVRELAPGYVEKVTPPVVEFPSMHSDRPDAGQLYDARDFYKEAQVQDYLSDAHIAPKVEAFNRLPDGSTETISRDLRDNYEDAGERYSQLDNTITGNSSAAEKAQAMAAKSILDVKRKQQEAIAGFKRY